MYLIPSPLQDTFLVCPVVISVLFQNDLVFPLQNAHRALHDAENTILIFQKMCSVLCENMNISTGDDLPELVERFSPKSPLRTAKEAIITEAIESNSPVLIDYVSANPERPLIQQRKVVPLKLDGMRVHVFCHLRKAERTLRMKRFLKVKALPQEEADNSVI